MKNMENSRKNPAGFLLITLMALAAFSYSLSGDSVTEKSVPPVSQTDIQVPPPPFTEGIFPCSECHGDMETNPNRRQIEFHEEIVFKHDERNRWCLDCHDAENRDKLHLASGELVDFGESYRLCGQCHGPKYRDWRAGIHGRRTGNWNGQKDYLLCAHCHNPHSPRFVSIKPEPAPERPGSGK